MTKPLTIGLTGGIGSGKTTVAKLFAELDIDIIDADQIARETVQPNTLPLQQITEHFSQQVLNPDGSLNRSKLREIVFAKPDERQWLESILHPLIRRTMQMRIEQAVSPYCIAVIPLLVENLPHPLIDRILVVDAPEHLQLERLQQRDSITLSQAKKILRAQATREQRLRHADDIITNDNGMTKLKRQVAALHQHYLQLAKKMQHG